MPSEPADITAARELLNVLSGDQPTTTTLLGRAEADLRQRAADQTRAGELNIKPERNDPRRHKPPQSAQTAAPSQMLDERISERLIKLERAKRAPRCQHIKADGVRCGSPAIRHKNFCYVHHQLRIPKPNPMRRLPSFEDANGVQCAIMQVAEAVLQKQLDRQTANTILYALQTAASNLKRVRFEPPLSKLVENETGLL